MSNEVKLTPAQQAAAVRRIRENLSLSSGAGCGKTFVLARRFSELLLKSDGKDNPLSGLVALTFTDKAAMEMSQRVRKLLSDFAAGARSSKDREKLLRWLEELPEARISTIHSFCGALLRTHAIEAGVDPNFSVCADELVLRSMINEAADTAILRAVEEQHAGVGELLSNTNYDRVLEEVRGLVSDRLAWRDEDYSSPQETCENWEEAIRQMRSELFARLGSDASFAADVALLEQAVCSRPDDKLLPLRDGLLTKVRHLLENEDNWTATVFEEAALCSPGRVGSAKNWGGKEALAAVKQAMKNILAVLGDLSICAAGLNATDRYAARALATLTGLAGSAIALYSEEKTRRGLLDFTDLLENTRRLLEQRPDVRRSLGESIDQLLLDEAQDTDAFQVEMLCLLLFDHACPDRLPDGRLFLVGDDKQSIYRFRGAQVEVFRTLCSRIGRDKRELLDISFRTHEAGIAFVNRLFEGMMGDSYEPIRAFRKTPPPEPSVEVLLAEGESGQPAENSDEATAMQAAATADWIHRAVHEQKRRIVWDAEDEQWREVRYGDIAVLFSRMTDSLHYERELAIRDVPYYVVGGTGFFRQQEVFDTLNALRVIDNPYDDIALVGVLRSALTGLDDNAILHLAQSADAPYFESIPHAADKLRSRLGPVSTECVMKMIALLRRLHAVKDAIGIDRLIEQLLEFTGYEAVLLSQPQGKRMLGNVRMLVEMAREAAEGAIGLAEFLRQMNDQVLNESRYEQAAVVGEAENVVRIMTIHKSKGLEFPVVIVPDLNAGRQAVRRPLLHRHDWGLTTSLAFETADSEDADEKSVAHQLALAAETEDQRAEDIRKFYVALTRHEDHLVLFGANWRDKSGLLRNKGSFIRLVDEQLGFCDALADGKDRLCFDGTHEARIGTWPAVKPKRKPIRTSDGEEVLQQVDSAEDFASALVRAGESGPALPLLGPLDEQSGRVELAVTALSEFAVCPMLYRWRYELRAPVPEQIAPPKPDDAPMPMDPATLGTFLHRCMELVAFDELPSAESLVGQTAAEMGMLELPQLGKVVTLLEDMLGTFGRHPLRKSLQEARCVYRELDFVMQAGPAELRGQIDLAYQDTDGRLHIVDYKSDRLGEKDPAEHAGRYRLQMLCYAQAANRHFGSAPADADLYFLRNGLTHRFDIGQDGLTAAEQQIRNLARRIIRARRLNRYEQAADETCRHCFYRHLCAGQTPNGQGDCTSQPDNRWI
ncbi:MAG: UvrD-helicase domain-containing protein [Phycisphaerae bacterium]